ncbi:MAG: hypothetical protein ACI30M_02875 [Muribaculaceae bacterium]
MNTIRRDSPSLPDGGFDATTEPLRGSIIVYSGHYPHTECLRHFSVGFGSSLCRQRAPALCADAH